MGSEWRQTSLGNVLELKRGYDLPKRKRIAGNIPLISSAGISDNHSESKVKGPGVVTGRYGTIGQVFFCSNDFWPLNTTLYVRDFKGNDPKFIYYFLKTLNYHEYSDKAAVPGVNRNHLHMAEVTLPSNLPEQKAIAHILGSLDDKIELNRRMNATLEQMAQALFKSWFVDFDPVIDNALAAGNPIPDALRAKAECRMLNAEKNNSKFSTHHSSFPSAFQLTEEMGWIPAGWEVKSLGNILRSVSDTYPLKTVDEVIFLNTGDILDGKFLHHDLSGTTGLPGQAKKSILKEDILYSEIRPKNRRFAYVYFDSPKHVVSTKLMVLRATSDVSSMFAYLILKQNSTIDYLQMMAESRSGTFPQITFDIVSKIEVALPKKAELASTFTETILGPTFQKQLQNDTISDELSKLRDTLLPKLISGELRILDAVKMVQT